MYMLQLFDMADEVQPIDVRLIRDGLIRIGRDVAADWPIADPDCELSRSHCELALAGDDLTVRALGTNGVFDDATGDRFPASEPVIVAMPATLRFGRFRLRATRAPHDDTPVDVAGTILMRAPLGMSSDVPAQWSDAALPPGTGDGSLLDAFCEGAGLDASLLSSEDPADVMRRAGAVYRQMVLGIGDLMAERDRSRGRYKLSRTTIGGHDNNPFKWAPTQRLAIDLLLAGSSGFLSGPAALQASFRDIKRHLIASFAGLQASLRAAIAAFDPAVIDETIAGRATLLKSRATLHVEESSRRHADLSCQLDAGSGGSLERAFMTAYDATEVVSEVSGRS